MRANEDVAFAREVESLPGLLGNSGRSDTIWKKDAVFIELAAR